MAQSARQVAYTISMIGVRRLSRSLSRATPASSPSSSPSSRPTSASRDRKEAVRPQLAFLSRARCTKEVSSETTQPAKSTGQTSSVSSVILWVELEAAFEEALCQILFLSEEACARFPSACQLTPARKYASDFYLHDSFCRSGSTRQTSTCMAPFPARTYASGFPMWFAFSLAPRQTSLRVSFRRSRESGFRNRRQFFME